MRKPLVRSMFAVALMAMLVMAAQAPSAHAAPIVANTSCSTTYWQTNTDVTVAGTNGYSWEFQLIELRDYYSNGYCGSVFTRAGLYVPKGITTTTSTTIKVYNLFYLNGSWLGTTSKYYYNVPGCCASGPYWINSNSHSVSTGSKVTVTGQAQDNTGSNIGGLVGTDFWVY